MNIFVLDTDTRKCAQYHADQHVVKMTLESTQILCTVLTLLGLEAPYKPTHAHHPCVRWAGQSLSNWRWLLGLVFALNAEYRYRFERLQDHRSAQVARSLPTPPIEDIGLTEFAQAMPAIYRVPGDPVQAYRRFYMAEKSRFATWTKRPPPAWFRARVPRPGG
jgi:hypothetical protein